MMVWKDQCAWDSSIRGMWSQNRLAIILFRYEIFIKLFAPVPLILQRRWQKDDWNPCWQQEICLCDTQDFEKVYQCTNYLFQGCNINFFNSIRIAYLTDEVRCWQIFTECQVHHRWYWTCFGESPKYWTMRDRFQGIHPALAKIGFARVEVTAEGLCFVR